MRYLPFHFHLFSLFYYSNSTFLPSQVKSKTKLITQGNYRSMHTRHERLWAEESINLQDTLYKTKNIKSFAVDHPNNVINFHSILVENLLTGL